MPNNNISTEPAFSLPSVLFIFNVFMTLCSLVISSCVVRFQLISVNFPFAGRRAWVMGNPLLMQTGKPLLRKAASTSGSDLLLKVTLLMIVQRGKNRGADGVGLRTEHHLAPGA